MKKLLLIILSLGIAFSMVLAPAAFAAPNAAVSRTAAFINLAKQKNLVDAGLSDLSPEEVRIIGTYLSNFYVPFRSEFGGDLESSEDANKRKEELKKSMVNALKTKLNYEDTAATSLVEFVIANIWKGSVDLSLRLEGDVTHDFSSISWPDFLSILSGNYQDPDGQYDLYNDHIKKGSLFYNTDSGTVTVFEFSMEGGVTPSVFALVQALSMSDLKSGPALALFDLQTTQLDFTRKPGDLDAKQKTILDAIKDDPYKQSFFNSKMQISPFGDLVVKGPNHTYVALPAAMNPGTWKPTDPDNKSLIYVAASYQNLLLSSVPDTPKIKSTVDGGDASPVVQSTPQGISYLLDQKGNNYLNSNGMHLWDSNFGPNKWFAGVVRNIQVGSKETQVPNEGWPLIDASGWDGVFQKTLDTYKQSRTQVIYNYKNHMTQSPRGETIQPFFSRWDFDRSLFLDPNKRAKYEAAASSLAARDRAALDQEFPAPNLYVFPNFSNQIPSSQKIYVVDNLAAYEGTSTDQSKFLDVVSPSGSPLVNITEGIQSSSLTALGSALSSSADLAQRSAEAMPRSAGTALYVTYILAAFGDEGVKSKLGYEYNGSKFPKLSEVTLSIPKEAITSKRVDMITNYVYYFMNPSWDNVDYFAEWANVKLSGLLLRWHSDMVGTQSANILSGSTHYIGFAGFVSTPNLTDMEWTDAIVSFYNMYSPYLILGVFVMLALYVMLRMVTVPNAVMSLVVFSVFAMSLFPLINGTVNIGNRFNDSLYSSKFVYWAVTSHQSYASKIDEAATGTNYQNYLKEVFNTSPSEENNPFTGAASSNTGFVSNRGGENILLKWQTPKKQLSKPIDGDVSRTLQSSPSLAKLWAGASYKAFSGETFVDDPNSTFLYRSYIDITNASRYTYKGLSSRYSGGTPKQAHSKSLSPAWPASYVDSRKSASKVMANDISNGYSNSPIIGDSSADSMVYVTAPASSKIVNDHLKDYDKLDKLTYGTYVGIPGSLFKASIAPFTQGTTFKEDLSSQGVSDLQGYSEQEFASLQAFSLFSESPFYHFSWKLYDQGLNPGSTNSGGYKDLILSRPNQGFFYNSVNTSDAKKSQTSQQSGEIKDYLGMRELFTYTIPYLHEANRTVKEYDEKYGLTFHKGIPFEPGHENDPEIKNNPEIRQKYWQNVNVAQLANQYTAWVDLLYSTDAAKSQQVKVNGKMVTITDPLDPTSYPADRPMVFSPAEMVDYGLTNADLTTAEFKIMEVLRNSREPMYSLLNYYSFKDTVMDSAAAMMITFQFNKTFSDSSFLGIGNEVQLYPQSYELKNFSYDAYLRMIMANSLGEDILDTNVDFYRGVVQKSSIFTAVAMNVTDSLSIHVIPLVKYSNLLSISLASLLLLMSVVLKAHEGGVFKKVMTVTVKPLIGFLIISLSFSFIISLFMGDPVNAVTGQRSLSIRFSDPVLTLFALCAVTVVSCILYCKILISAIKNIKTYGTAAFGTVGATLATAGKRALQGIGAVAAFSGAAAAGVGGAVQSAGRGARNAAYGAQDAYNSRFGVAVRARLQAHGETSAVSEKAKTDLKSTSDKGKRKEIRKAARDEAKAIRQQKATEINEKIVEGSRRTYYRKFRKR